MYAVGNSRAGLFVMDKTSAMYLYVQLNRDANGFLSVECKGCINSAKVVPLQFLTSSVGREFSYNSQGCEIESHKGQEYFILNFFALLAFPASRLNPFK